MKATIDIRSERMPTSRAAIGLMAQARIALPVVVYRKSTVTAASATMVVPQIHSVWWSSRAPSSVNVPGLNEGSESGSLPQISSAAPRRTTPKPRLATTRPSSPTCLRSGATVSRSWTSATPATAKTEATTPSAVGHPALWAATMIMPPTIT